MKTARISHLRLFHLLALLLVPVGLSACVIGVSPPTDTNPTGTSHTVIAEISTDLDEILGEGAMTEPVEDVFEWQVTFDVVDGPNEGETSTDTNDCMPSCFGAEGSATVSWTYTSNGLAGTDTIRVCTVEPGTSIDEVSDEDAAVTLALIEELFDIEADNIQDVFCRFVTKTWVEPDEPERERRNVSGAIAGIVGAIARERQATVVAGQQPAPPQPEPPSTIRPPSTGHGGLR